MAAAVVSHLLPASFPCRPARVPTLAGMRALSLSRIGVKLLNAAYGRRKWILNEGEHYN